MSVHYREDTWGLTWSGRWHLIDPGKGKGWNGEGAVSRCGSFLYRQDELRTAAHPPSRLKAIVEDPTKAAGECKKCVKKVAHGV